MTAPQIDYAAFYCEENIWRLCQNPALADMDCDVVFISNHARQCALWGQRAGRSGDGLVLWDYHVVLLARGEQGAQIWDLDAMAGCPLAFEAWWEASWPRVVTAPRAMRPLFRVVARARFVEVFSSDRGHMCAGGVWSAAPPAWPRIGSGPSNLMEFVSMREGFEGRVMEAGAFEAYARVSGSQRVKTEP
jgi:hypothetical protein